jgi:protein-L-isoaspartate(D-aspartate) O-methyltransferase
VSGACYDADVSRTLASQLAGMGIRDERVLWAIEQVPRELFVPEPLRPESEADRPLPIGHGQTISQPYIVAVMTEALALTGMERVL